MRKITKIRRTVRAISPVISVLLMIAIAVAASLVAYAWVSGYMDFTTTKVGKSIQIQSISTTAVYVQNVGDSPVTITDIYVDGVLDTHNNLTAATPLGTSGTLTILFTSGYELPREGNQATIKIVTEDGISAQLTKTFSGSSSGSGSPTTANVNFVMDIGGSSISPAAGIHSYTIGQVISISTAAATDYIFNEWTATGSIVIADEYNPVTTATINSAGTITATFTYSPATYYDVDFVLGLGGASMNPSDDQSYPEGLVVPISATADVDYEFNEWTATGSITIADSTLPSTTATINSAGTITATFTYAPVTYDVDFILGAGGLSLTPDDGPYVGDVAISATAQTGYTFNQWESTGSITFVDAGSASTTATVSGAGTITATFTQDEYTLTVNVDGSGSVTKNPNQATYHYGDSVTLTANPGTGYHFTEWSGDLSGSTNPETIVINGNTAVTATFEENAPVEHTLVLRPIGTGSVTENTNPTWWMTSNWECVDDSTSDGDSTYIYDNSQYDGDNTDTYATANPDGSITGTITKVDVYIVCRRSGSGSGTSYARTSLRIGGTTYNGDRTALGSSWAILGPTSYATNPNGGSAWTWTNINDLECGVTLESGDTQGSTQNVAWCTQVWIEVTYLSTTP
jgi:FlaG/FlaF family flagellin (archaellin)